MLQKLKFLFWAMIGITIMLVSACAPTPAPLVATATSSATSIPPTATHTPTTTPAPTDTPTITPTPFGGENGDLIYTDGWTVYSYSFREKTAVKLADNCLWNMTFSGDGHYLACSKFKPSGTLGDILGITLIDLKSKKIINSFLDGENIGVEDLQNRGPLDDVLEFSPDNSLIAFIGKIKEKRGVYVIDTQTRLYKLIYENPLADGILWSPDGGKIVISLNPTPGFSSGGYYVINADGSNLVNVAHPNNYPKISWGKDNNTVFIRGDGIDLKTLKPNGEILQSDYFTSPDGKYHFDMDHFDKALGFSETLVNSDGSKKIKTPGISYSFSHWSTDSKFLYYYNFNEKIMYSLNIETLKSTVLVKIADYTNIMWLPDVTGLLFTQVDSNGGFDVCFSDLSGNITKLANTKYPTQLHLETTEKKWNGYLEP